MRAQATRWLRQPIAGGMRAGIELEQAAKWLDDRTHADNAALLREWFAAAYDFRLPDGSATTPLAARKVDAAVQAMPLTTRWLTDRADRVDAARLLVASPAAVAVAAAAAQALTEADMRLLAATPLPHAHAHLLLSEPVITVRTFDESAPDDALALTWWPTTGPTGSTIRIIDWLATNGPVRVDGFERARRTSARTGTEMPALYFHGERALSVTPAGIDDDPLLSEGEFTFDDPIYDPDWDFLPRFMLSIRHLVVTDALRVTTFDVMRPDSRSATNKRVPVDVITAVDDRAHTAALLDPHTITRIRRTRVDHSIRWQAATFATTR